MKAAPLHPGRRTPPGRAPMRASSARVGQAAPKRTVLGAGTTSMARVGRAAHGERCSDGHAGARARFGRARVVRAARVGPGPWSAGRPR